MDIKFIEQVVGKARPDRVELPAALGGGKVDVTNHFYGPSPNGDEDNVRHLVLANSINVAECENGLVWYARG